MLVKGLKLLAQTNKISKVLSEHSFEHSINPLRALFDILHVFNTTGCWEVAPSLWSCPKTFDIAFTITGAYNSICLSPSPRSSGRAHTSSSIPLRHVIVFYSRRYRVSGSLDIALHGQSSEDIDKFPFSLPYVVVFLLAAARIFPYTGVRSCYFGRATYGVSYHSDCSSVSSSDETCFWVNKLITMNFGTHFSWSCTV